MPTIAILMCVRMAMAATGSQPAVFSALRACLFSILMIWHIGSSSTMRCKLWCQPTAMQTCSMAVVCGRHAYAGMETHYIYWGDPDYGIFMVKTKNPAGAWDAPVLVVEGKGLIDPSPLWDDDGRMYLVNGWANSRCGFNSVLTVRELSADGTVALSNPVMVYDGLSEGNHTIEGPKFYHRDGYYYILAPAGGVEKGYQLALRSKSVYGPYESKKVFDREGIHQGGWVDGRFVCFQERGAYGRVLHLLDVGMKDGWPMMRVSKADKPCHLAYDVPALAYQWHSNYDQLYGFASHDGCRVYGHYVDSSFVNFWSVPNLYMKKFEMETFTDTLSATVTAVADGSSRVSSSWDVIMPD